MGVRKPLISTPGFYFRLLRGMLLETGTDERLLSPNGKQEGVLAQPVVPYGLSLHGGGASPCAIAARHCIGPKVFIGKCKLSKFPPRPVEHSYHRDRLPV